MRFVEVILPLPLPGLFTYQVPREWEGAIGPGYRVVAQFGAKKIYTGIVYQVIADKPEDFEAKELLDVLDEQPVIQSIQLDFFQWMSAYYMSTLGEVMNAALPSGLKLSSQSFVSLRQEVNPEELELSDREYELLVSLRKTDRSIEDVGEIIGLKQPQKLIKSLAERGLIDLFEKVKDRYQPKTVKKVRLTERFLKENLLETLINDLETKPKQQDVLLSYLRSVPVLENPSSNNQGILKPNLLSQDISASSLKTLIKNHIFTEWDEVVSRLSSLTPSGPIEIELNEIQKTAKEEILEQFEQHHTILLHGVTGSGKTEIYMELIQEQLEIGKQVLFLLPEIALTTQIISRLQRAFGNTFGVYHSRYSDNERVEVWKKVLNNEYQFIVGVRSSVFLPFQNLGLIIVDEEHEPSYKQFEPNPRYHARDAAIYLSILHKANTLLGTATPAIETYQNTLDGKYGRVTISERFGDSTPPEILFADLTRERKKKMMKGNLSSMLFEAIEQALEQKEQVILFQNRRGYASFVSCTNCAYVPKCPNCAVSLTYHQYNEKLICHYCGYNQPMLTDCTNCGNHEIRTVGYGTEELEEELKIMFPQAIVQRMDLDTTRSKHGYQRIIESFEEGEIDILVGTQMVSKGLDFDKVNLVGIFDADRMIHFQDFRAEERAYQLMTQVSGRAGRKSDRGQVIIQTADPQQAILAKIRSGNYQTFFQGEVLERSQFSYPPFHRLITITFKHRDKKTSWESALFYTTKIRDQLGGIPIIGPVEPIVGRIRNQYLHEITLKIAKGGINLQAVKALLLEYRKFLHQNPIFKSVGVVFDVDPV